MWARLRGAFPPRRRPARSLWRAVAGRWLWPVLGVAVASYVGVRLWKRT